ncbi:hypothetical protein MFIFM68171_02165 [Madurella fahalii]|uniref:Uncharacterized protein n=1 Tax=Madurella fahalii TaxID=1157608 RepID=A0ABQ0G324_9PEZI
MAQAISLVHDQQPRRSAAEDVQAMGVFAAGFSPWSWNTAAMSRDEFLERQRGILVCFVPSSTLSPYFGQGDALRWTPDMEDGLAAISANRDCPTDAGFAAQSGCNFWPSDRPRSRSGSSSKTGRDKSKNSTSRCHRRSASRAWLPRTSTRPSCMSPRHIHRPLDRLGHGEPVRAHSRHRRPQQRVMALGAPTLSLAERAVHPGLHSRVASVVGRRVPRDLVNAVGAARVCVAVLNWLTDTLADPTWDRPAVRNVISMPGLVGCVADKLESAGQAAGERVADGLFTRLLQAMCEFYAEANIAPRTGQK